MTRENRPAQSTWSRSRPTQTGWYWYWNGLAGQPTLVRIENKRSGLGNLVSGWWANANHPELPVSTAQTEFEENDLRNGTDCVTPFDHYLYGAPEQPSKRPTARSPEQVLIEALVSEPCGRNPIEGQAWPWVQAHMAHRSSFYHRLGLSENHQVILLVDLFLHIRNALATLNIDREFLKRRQAQLSLDAQLAYHRKS